jgi:hypothetical protein
LTTALAFAFTIFTCVWIYVDTIKAKSKIPSTKVYFASQNYKDRQKTFCPVKPAIG